MKFYLYVQGCSIIAPITLDAQREKLDAARKLVEHRECNQVEWQERNENVNDVHDVYEAVVSVRAFIDYLDDVIAPLVRQHDCEVYW